jgi:hypothetical protein
VNGRPAFRGGEQQTKNHGLSSPLLMAVGGVFLRKERNICVAHQIAGGGKTALKNV